jgi:hypothetical protein
VVRVDKFNFQRLPRSLIFDGNPKPRLLPRHTPDKKLAPRKTATLSSPP